MRGTILVNIFTSGGNAAQTGLTSPHFHLREKATVNWSSLEQEGNRKYTDSEVRPGTTTLPAFLPTDGDF